MGLVTVRLVRYMVLLAPLLLYGCGKSAMIPVEEHSSIKLPPVAEVYYRAATAPEVHQARPPAEVVVTRAVQKAGIEEEAMQWREIPTPTQRNVEPVWETVSEEPMIVSRAQVGRDRDDPLLSLLKKIERAMGQGEYQRAEGLLERALRIDSQRAGLWHDLGQVRFHQEAYDEAITLARRSNRLAAGSAVLREENWLLIARAKEALGDLEGARVARKKAEQ